MAEADFDSVRPALDSAGEESEDGESDQSDFVDVLEPGDVVVLDPVPSAAASGGGASTISSSSSSSSNTNSGGGGDGSSMVPHMASDVPDWMQSLGALPQSARVDRTAINQNFKDYSTREADAVVTREDGDPDAEHLQNLQRSLDKRDILDLVNATKSEILKPIPDDSDMAAALVDDVRKQKVEVVNWKFWKKMDETESLREKLKAYCRRYEKMLLKHSKLFSKRYERTLAARTEAAKEWEAKELQLEKWAKHRYMPQFRRLHELLETKLDQLLQMDILAAKITNNRCQDTTAMYATLKQYSPNQLAKEYNRQATTNKPQAAKSKGREGSQGTQMPGDADSSGGSGKEGRKPEEGGTSATGRGGRSSQWEKIRSSMKKIASHGHPWIDEDFFMTLQELLERDGPFQSVLKAHRTTCAEFDSLQRKIQKLTPKLMPMRQLDRSRLVTGIVNAIIKANGAISERAVQAFNGIILDRRNFEGRLMARWQQGYLDKCTSVPPDAIIVFVEHIASLVTKNYLNTGQLDESGKDSLKEVMQKLAEAMIYPLPAVKKVLSAYNLSALDKMNANFQENLEWVKDLPPELIKIDHVFIHKDFVDGKMERPFARGTHLLRKSAMECVPFRCIDYLLEAVRLLHEEAAAACVSNGSEVLPMGAEDFFPILVYACIHSGVKNIFTSICFAFYYGTDSGNSGNSEGAYYTTSWMAAATWVVCLRRLSPEEIVEKQKVLDAQPEQKGRQPLLFPYEQLPMEGNTLSMDQDEDEIDEAVRKLKAFSDSNQHFEDTVNAIL